MRSWNRKVVTRYGLDIAVASGAAATAGPSANAEEFFVLWSISGVYFSAPTAGAVVVAFGGVTKWKVDISDANPFDIVFPRGLYTGTKNEALLVTLADGSQEKDLNITYS